MLNFETLITSILIISSSTSSIGGSVNIDTNIRLLKSMAVTVCKKSVGMNEMAIMIVRMISECLRMTLKISVITAIITHMVLFFIIMTGLLPKK